MFQCLVGCFGRILTDCKKTAILTKGKREIHVKKKLTKFILGSLRRYYQFWLHLWSRNGVFCCFLNFSSFITPSKNFITVLSLCDCQSILILTKNEILENNLLSFHFMWCDWLISRIPMKSLLSSAALCAKLHLVPNWKKVMLLQYSHGCGSGSSQVRTIFPNRT